MESKIGYLKNVVEGEAGRCNARVAFINGLALSIRGEYVLPSYIIIILAHYSPSMHYTPSCPPNPNPPLPTILVAYPLNHLQISWRYIWALIRFVLHVLQLLPIRFTLWNLCCISKFMMKHWAKLGVIIRSPLISLWLLELHLCWFFDWIHKSSPITECGVLNKSWRHTFILLNTWIFMVFVLWCSLVHFVIKYNNYIPQVLNFSLIFTTP